MARHSLDHAEGEARVGGDGRRPGRAQFDRVAAVAGIKPKRAAAIVEEVDAALAGWPDFSEACKVPGVLAGTISAAMTAAREW